MTALPGLQVLVAFQNNATDDPQTFTSIVDGRTHLGAANVWTDITSFVAGGQGATVTIGRGRQHELNRFDAGQLNLMLNNNDGRFNPWNTQSLYYPFLTPMIPVQVRATVGGIQYNRFTGQINAWPTRWPDPLSAWGEIQANDAFRIFNLSDLPTSVYYQAVFGDSPELWFRLGDAGGSPAATSTVPGPYTSGTPGTAAIGAGVTLGQTGLLPYDATTSAQFTGVGGIDFGAVSPAVGDFSVELWVKASLPTTGVQNVNIVGQGANSAGWGLYYNISSKTLNFLTPAGAANVTLDMTTGALHHIVVTYDGSTTVQFYIDGSPSGAPQVFGSNNPVALVGDMQLGTAGAPFAGPTNPATNYIGFVQDFAIYDSQLGPGQVFNHFDSGLRSLKGGGAGAAISWALGAVGWPPSATNLQNGSTVFQATQPGTSAKALSFMQQCEVTEDGALFMDGGGLVTFVDRTGILTDTERAVPQVIFGDIPGLEVAYEPGPDNALDELDVYNSVTVTRAGGVAQKTTNQASIGIFGSRDLNLSTLSASDVDALYLSQTLVDRYSQPVQRLRSIVINMLDLSTAEQQSVLDLDLLDRIIVNRWGLPGNSSPFTTEALIERIDEQIAADSYTVTLALSPINAIRYWILGDPVYGVLGSTTKLANATMGSATAPSIPPGPPTTVFVDQISGTSATIHWQEPLTKGSSGIAFDVVQLLAGGQVVATFPVTAPASSYVITGLSPLTNYQATVFSEPLFGATGQPFKPPVNFTTTAGVGTSLTAPNAGLVAMKAPAGTIVSTAGTVVAGSVAVTQMLAPAGSWGIGGTVVRGSAAVTTMKAPTGTVVSTAGTKVVGKVAVTSMSAPAGALGGGSSLTAPNAGTTNMVAPAGSTSGGTVGGSSSQTIQAYWVGQIWASHAVTPTEVQNFGSGGGNAFNGVPQCVVSIQPQQVSTGANGAKTDGGASTFSISQLKSATSGNPNMKIYRYQNGSHITGVDTGDPLWAPGTTGNPATPVAMTVANQANLQASFYRYDSAGNKVAGSWGPDLSNPSSSGLQQYRAAAAARDVSQGYDGTFLDSCGTDAPGYKNVLDPDFTPYAKPTVANWIADTSAEAGYINGPHGQGSTGTASPDIISNALSSVDVYSASGGGAIGTSTISTVAGKTGSYYGAANCYTAMCEQYLRFYGTAVDATGFPGGSNNPYNGGYADWIAMVHDATATQGGRFTGMVKLWMPLSATAGPGVVTAAQRDQWWRVGVAVILMGYTGVGSAAISLTCGKLVGSGPQDTDALAGYPILTLALGQPTSPNTMATVVDVVQGGLWRRAFTNGLVLLNPTTSQINHVLLSPGPNYVSQVGSTPGTALTAGTAYNAGATVPIPPNDAVFLLGH